MDKKAQQINVLYDILHKMLDMLKSPQAGKLCADLEEAWNRIEERDYGFDVEYEEDE